MTDYGKFKPISPITLAKKAERWERALAKIYAVSTEQAVRDIVIAALEEGEKA